MIILYFTNADGVTERRYCDLRAGATSNTHNNKNMYNEFINDLECLQKTGDIPHNNNYIINQLIELINKSEKRFWRVLREYRPGIFDTIYSLDRNQIISLIEDVEDRKVLPAYKKLSTLNIVMDGGMLIDFNI